MPRFRLWTSLWTDYRTVIADATAPEFAERGPFDLIVTAFLAEHVPDPRAFHAVVHRRSVPAGSPSTSSRRSASRRSSPTCSSRSVSASRSCGGSSRAASPKATTRGSPPTTAGAAGRQIRRFERAGFEMVDYVGYSGHGYFDRFWFLDRPEQALSRALTRRPVPALTSYATVLLRRR